MKKVLKLITVGILFVLPFTFASFSHIGASEYFSANDDPEPLVYTIYIDQELCINCGDCISEDPWNNLKHNIDETPGVSFYGRKMVFNATEYEGIVYNIISLSCPVDAFVIGLYYE